MNQALTKLTEMNEIPVQPKSYWMKIAILESDIIGYGASGRNVSTRGFDMDNDLNEDTFEGLKNDVRTIFPTLKEIRFSDAWGGPVSVPIDMAPALGYLGDERVAYSLGCVGHGVSLTHLNGKTIRDLVLERKTGLTDVFFVNRKQIPWPPEPFKTMSIKAIKGYLHLEDSLYDGIRNVC